MLLCHLAQFPRVMGTQTTASRNWSLRFLGQSCEDGDAQLHCGPPSPATLPAIVFSEDSIYARGETAEMDAEGGLEREQSFLTSRSDAFDAWRHSLAGHAILSPSYLM